MEVSRPQTRRTRSVSDRRRKQPRRLARRLPWAAGGFRSLQEVDVEMLGTNEAAAGPSRGAATAPGAGPIPDTAWRTRDIVVAAVIGVAFGVVFWVWGFVWTAVTPLNNVFPVLQDSLYAVWLIPAVLAPL